MFRQKLNPGGMLVPIATTAAKQSLKKPLWNMLKFGAMPWALDQAADLMTMDLKTQEPDSTENPNDKTITAELVEDNVNNQMPSGGKEPNAPGNVDLSQIEGNVGSEEKNNNEKNASFSDDTVGSGSKVSSETQSGLYAGAQDLDAGTLFPQDDSLSQVKDYADALRGMLGTDSGQRMANTAMLAQLGMALMTGKTMQGGVSGFLDVAGQAGLQVAPMMIQMGMEKSKQDRELGIAAFQIWKEEQDKLKKRSGSFYNVYEVGYEFDAATGRPKKLPNGQPKYSSNTFRDVVQQNSPEMTDFIAINQDPNRNPNYPFPLYIPISQSATEAGGAGVATRTSGLSPITAAGGQDQLKFAKFISTNMDEMYKYLKIIMDKQHLIGAKGELGRWGTAPAYYFNELLNQSGMTEEQMAAKHKGQSEQVIDFFNSGWTEGGSLHEDAQGEFGIVNETPNSTMKEFYGAGYTGPNIDIFVDTYNEKGQNPNVNANNKYGDPSVYLVKGELERIFTDPDIPGVQVFESTIGLLLARSRQPTGRMLADVLRRSFNEASVTGFTGPNARPNFVINKIWALANKLEGDMQSGFKGANVMSEADAIRRYGSVANAEALGITVDNEPFSFPAKQAAIHKYYELYFQQQPDGIWVEQYTNHPLGTTPHDFLGDKKNTVSSTSKNDFLDQQQQFEEEMKRLNVN